MTHGALQFGSNLQFFRRNLLPSSGFTELRVAGFFEALQVVASIWDAISQTTVIFLNSSKTAYYAKLCWLFVFWFYLPDIQLNSSTEDWPVVFALRVPNSVSEIFIIHITIRTGDPSVRCIIVHMPYSSFTVAGPLKMKLHYINPPFYHSVLLTGLLWYQQ